MVEKSDAMRMHEEWINETLKRKPKHRKEGLPVEPWHVLMALGAIAAIMIIIGAILNR